MPKPPRIMCRPSQQAGMKVATCHVWPMRPPFLQRALLYHLIPGVQTDAFSRKPMQTSWANDAECLACGDGGLLLLCDLCPASYHLECAGVEQVAFIVVLRSICCSDFTSAITCLAQVPARQWVCAHHACSECGKKAHECSNCLFR